MSGVFGIVDTRRETDIPHITKCMASEMSHRDWFVADSYIDDNNHVAIGRIGIGIFNKQPQPVWNLSHTVALVLTGEFYNKDLIFRSRKDYSQEQFVMELYETEGIRFVRKLDGPFCIAILDLNKKKLFIANDRFGLYPHYYHLSAGKFIFSPEIKGILCDNTISKKLDWVALAQFTKFQRLLGSRTFFDDIHLLPYSSILTFDINSATMNISHYWGFEQIPKWQKGVTFRDAVDETGRLLTESVRKSVEGEEKVGVYLSGGLDSRTILGLASSVTPGIPSLTYGVPNCRDAVYAQKIAKKSGSPHYFFPIKNGKWVADYAEFHLDITEGFVTWTHCHPSLTLSPARDILSVNLTGFNGDQILGGRAFEVAPLSFSAPDDFTFLIHFYKYLGTTFTWPGVDDSEYRLLFHPSVYKKVKDLAFESLKDELDNYSKYPIQNRLDFFTTVNQGTRLTNMNEVFKRSYFETRYPFCEKNLVDFIFSMPTEYRLNDKLYLAMINKIIPSLAWVPRASNNQLLINNKTIVSSSKYWHKVRNKLRKNRYSTIHEDPEGWLRNDLDDWAKSILFSANMENHGIFDVPFLASLYTRHKLGYESYKIVGKLAPVMTYEMMLRRFFD